MPLLHRIVSRGAKLLPRPVQLGLYKVPVLSGAIRWVLRRGTQDRAVLVTVVSGPLEGKRLYVNLRSQKYFWLGTHEPGVQTVACQQIGKGDVVYDVGAHWGYFSVLFGMQVGPTGQVHCFEPLPENIEILGKQLEVNGLEAVAKIVPVAVASRSGTATFRAGEGSGTGRLCGEDNEGRTITVNTMTLDEYVAQGNPPPDVIKMDIEGGETEAIAGMSEMLRQHKPKLIMEFHSGEAKRLVWDVLADLGYRCLIIGPKLELCSDPVHTKKRHFLFTAP